jgi:CheY-like chemotaxis protein
MGGRDFSRVSFLIVDDNDFSRSLVKTMLQAFRAKNLKEARDGGEAYELLKKGQIDIVLCDYAMKPMSGLEFVRQVRNERSSPSPYVPIIMLTAYSNYEDVCATRDSGVNEYLAKPFSVQALADRILSVIDHPRPYIRCPDYFGPDRRRHVDPDYAGPFRRATDKVKVG